MLRSMKFFSLCAMMIGCTAATSEAAFSLRVIDQGAATTVTIDDGGAGDELAAVNEIRFNGTVGSFTISDFRGETNTPGADTAFLIDSTFAIRNTGAVSNTITLLVSATGFTSPDPAPLMGFLASTVQFLSGTSNPATASATIRFYGSDDGTATGLFKEDILITTNLSNIAAPNGNDNKNSNGIFDGITIPYSLTLRIDVVLSAGARIDVDSTARIEHFVPEPTSMAILGLGGLLAGFGVARRKRKQAAELTV